MAEDRNPTQNQDDPEQGRGDEQIRGVADTGEDEVEDTDLDDEDEGEHEGSL